MRIIIAILAGLFLLAFVLTTFLPAPEAQVQAARTYFTTADIDTGLRLTFQRKWLMWTSVVVNFTFLTLLACSTRARRLADVFARWTGGRWLLTLLLMGGFCFVVTELLQLPLRLLGFELSRSWGLNTQSALDWWLDYGKSLAIQVPLQAVGLLAFYLLLRWCPRWWPVLAAVLAGVFGVLYAWLLPVLINPLFNEFTPLQDANLEQRVQRLAERAGVPVSEVLVMDASRRGVYTNAYFTGFGSTRRIVLYDTLIKDHQPAEIESVIAHEIGHWLHHHIYQGLALGSAGLLLGLVVLRWLLVRAVGREPFALRSQHDPASLPLLLLLMALGTWLAMPIENAVSRHFERQADAAALELARAPDAFIAAEVRMTRTNKGNILPHPFSVWLFATHPPVLERIRMAEEWKVEHPAG